jgi:hypothetical protein
MVKPINRKLLDEVKDGDSRKRKIFVWDEGDGAIDAEVERLEKLHEGEDVEIVIVGWNHEGEEKQLWQDDL